MAKKNKVSAALFGNWKTTLAGIISAIGPVLVASESPIFQIIGAIMTSGGLGFLGITARDSDKSSADSGAE